MSRAKECDQNAHYAFYGSQMSQTSAINLYAEAPKSRGREMVSLRVDHATKCELTLIVEKDGVVVYSKRGYTSGLTIPRNTEITPKAHFDGKCMRLTLYTDQGNYDITIVIDTDEHDRKVQITYDNVLPKFAE